MLPGRALVHGPKTKHTIHLADPERGWLGVGGRRTQVRRLGVSLPSAPRRAAPHVGDMAGSAVAVPFPGRRVPGRLVGRASPEDGVAGAQGLRAHATVAPVWPSALLRVPESRWSLSGQAADGFNGLGFQENKWNRVRIPPTAKPVHPSAAAAFLRAPFCGRVTTGAHATVGLPPLAGGIGTLYRRRSWYRAAYPRVVVCVCACAWFSSQQRASSPRAEGSLVGPTGPSPMAMETAVSTRQARASL